MFSIVYAIRIDEYKTIEVPLERKFHTLEEAKQEAKSNQIATAYRIFDGNGYRVFSEKIEKNS